MKKNMGTTDGTLRLAVVFAIATSLVGTCPMYLPFGLSTCGRG